MGGNCESSAWQAFIAETTAVPLAQPLADEPATAVEESPLGPRLRRNATRHGDAVPYGQKGPWGLYREGVKEMTAKIHAGKLTPAEASGQLEAEGVNISEDSLTRRAKKAPGKSPVKGGAPQKLDYDLQAEVHKEIAVLRGHDLPVTKGLVKAMVVSQLTAEQAAALFPKGLTDRVYYGFLDNFDMNTEQTKPLESDRDLWLTSTNAEVQYQIWADLAVKNEMAVKNPSFDPEKEYDEMILWTPEGLERLLSMDETDVRTDQSKRGKSAATRSVLVNAPGSRRGHSKAKLGCPKSIIKPQRGGYAGGSKKVGGQMGLKPGQLDRGDALATKSSSKISFAGGTKGNGESLSPHIMANRPLTTAELDSAPVGTARDASGAQIPATFNVNSSGGMLEDDMLIWAEKIAAPSARSTPQKRGIWCLDGLGQHHTFKVVQKADQLNFDIALRFPHGSSRGQHEDFEHFSVFRPAHEDAKIAVQIEKFRGARVKAAAEGREPTRAELMAAATLTDAESLAAAKQPWMDAFSADRVRNGWKREGVVPFTRKLMWDLRKEEQQMGVKPSRVPPANLTGFNLPPLAPPATTAATAATSTALVGATTTDLVAAPLAWDEGIDEEVQRLLRAEVGDLTLNVPPVPPPKSQPKLGSSLLFKLPGGVTGEMGKQLVRAKEVERRLNVARKQYNSEKREGKRARQADNDFSVAAAALDTLKDNSFDLKQLLLPDLHSLERALGVGKGKGKKPDSIQLLQQKFGKISKAQFQSLVATVQRGIVQASVSGPSKGPLALPQPPSAPAPTSPSLTTVAPQPLALSRPRRGGA